MFIELMESDRRANRSLSGAAASLFFHTALISLAVAVTARARTESQRLDPMVHVTYMPQRSVAAPSATPAQQPSKPIVKAIPQAHAAPIVAPITVATGIPEVVLPASPAAGTVGIATPTPAGTGEPSSGESQGGPLTQYQVDKEVRAFPSNRAPVYPDALRSRGIEGEVFARFVVDESGRVDMKTFEVVSASSPQFASAVRYALERARFQPAEAAGRKVAQLVEQHFQFRLDPQSR